MQMNRWPFLRIKRQGLLALMCAFFMAYALANAAIYKCGQEVTNQPLDPQICQKLEASAAVQIEGTRVQSLPTGQTPQQLSAGVQNKVAVSNGNAISGTSIGAPITSAEQQQRQAQSRTILEDEWQKLSAQYADLVRNYKQGQPALIPGESAQSETYKQRVQDMKLQLQRLERDKVALQRELSRYTKNLPTAQLKPE
jgi:hypothetical protein